MLYCAASMQRCIACVSIYNIHIYIYLAAVAVRTFTLLLSRSSPRLLTSALLAAIAIARSSTITYGLRFQFLIGSQFPFTLHTCLLEIHFFSTNNFARLLNTRKSPLSPCAFDFLISHQLFFNCCLLLLAFGI